MKKLFASLLAALMLCTGLSQFAFAAEPTDRTKNLQLNKPEKNRTKSPPHHRKMTVKKANLPLTILLTD